MKKILKAVLFLYDKVYFKLQLTLFNKIIESKNAWLLFDKSNIPGFGTNLIRTYFPIYSSTKTGNSFSIETTNKMEAILHQGNYIDFTSNIINEIPDLLHLQKDETNKIKPYLDNYFFGIFDAAILGSMMQHFKPQQIIEIGSGISTRYMNYYKEKFELNAKIICIDPFPRVEIEEVANLVINLPLEMAIEKHDFKLENGDFIFMDGSHYVFQNNDTLCFFFKLLPSLPSGIIIHIHDIYLPYDYDSNVSQQLWAEQYILATMILSGLNDYKILYPAYHEACNNPKIKTVLKNADEVLANRNFQKRKSQDKGFSFWMQKK